jgi:hypothetical protein
MLYDLIQTRGGKETIYMTDSLPKVKARMAQLRASLRGKGLTFTYREAEEGAEKYRRPPNMNFCPSGDAGTKKYRNRVARAKKIKKNNPKRKESMFSFLLNDEVCPRCKVNLCGEGTIKVEDNLLSVNEGGRIVENISDDGSDSDTDLILDIKAPTVVCNVCGAELDISYNRED